MIKKLLVLVLLTTILFPFEVIAVTQGSDEVTLTKPSQSEAISGTYTVQWRIVDSEVSDPAYFIDIFNLSCEQSGGNIGRLLGSGASKNGNEYTYQWDTSTGEVASSLQNQGNYCMRVCSILADGGNVYSLCDKQSFVFASSGGQSQGNTPPVISTDEDSFDTSLNQVFSYKVNAVDPDNDQLTFSLVSSPNFLSIDSKTGEVSGMPTEVGNIKFIVKVDDGRGGIATQEFVLNVGVPGARKEIEFVFPDSGSVVSGDSNKIEWEVSSTIQARSVVLSYSQDRTDWNELTRLDRNTGFYEWNIDDVEPGEYYLRIQITDNSNKLFEVLSEKFSVSDAVAVEQTEITDLAPAEGSVLNDNRPVITAKFNTPQGVTIDPDDVTFMLNERIDTTVCDITESGITCNIVSELADDQYKAYIELVDSNGSTIVKEWPFTIQTASSGGGVSSGNIFQLVIIILAVGFVLIALPWSLYFFLKRRKNVSSENQTTPITPVGTSDPANPQPQAVTENVTNPTPSPLPVEVINPAESQGDSLAQPDMQVSQMQNPATVQPVSQNQYPPTIDPTSLTPEPLVNPAQSAPNYSTNSPYVYPEGNQISQQNPTLPGSYQAPQNIAPVQSQGAPQPNQNQTTTEPTQPVETGTPQSPTLSNVDNLGMPAPVAPPAMYAQDDIPEWMQGTKDEEVRPVVAEETNASTMEHIVNESNILEGAKVYDPYGIALNSDEVQSNNHT